MTTIRPRSRATRANRMIVALTATATSAGEWLSHIPGVADPGVENPAYHEFAVRLAELGKTLFSTLVRQYRRITKWLKTPPRVDPSRIGFDGLS